VIKAVNQPSKPEYGHPYDSQHQEGHLVKAAVVLQLSEELCAITHPVAEPDDDDETFVTETTYISCCCQHDGSGGTSAENSMSGMGAGEILM